MAEGTQAVVSAYVPTEKGRREVFRASGFVGGGGVGTNKREGDDKTPAGIYDVGGAFGLAEVSGLKVPYTRITAQDVWVDDPASRYYNRWVREDAPLRDWRSAEKLADETQAYKYAAIIEYNTADVVKGAGSAIFLHCNKQGPTAGCVSLPEADMHTLLYLLQPGTKIAIAPSEEALRRLTRLGR